MTVPAKPAPADPVIRTVLEGHWRVTLTGACYRCGERWGEKGCEAIRAARKSSPARKGARS